MLPHREPPSGRLPRSRERDSTAPVRTSAECNRDASALRRRHSRISGVRRRAHRSARWGAMCDPVTRLHGGCRIQPGARLARLRARYARAPGEAGQHVEKSRERLRYARRIPDADSVRDETGDGKAHRHSMVVVRLDVGGLRSARIDDEAVLLLVGADPQAPQLGHDGRTRSVSLRRMKPMPVTRVGPSRQREPPRRASAPYPRQFDISTSMPRASPARSPRSRCRSGGRDSPCARGAERRPDPPGGTAPRARARPRARRSRRRRRRNTRLPTRRAPRRTRSPDTRPATPRS